MVTLCAGPGGFERTEIAQAARADPRGFGVAAGGLLQATPDSLDVALDGARLHARFSARRDWPRRAFGALGPAQAVPWLGQYWTPHLLSAQVRGEAMLGDRELDLGGAHVYAEKNWGTAFASHWWWGQASLEEGGVAFAGGRVHGVAPTAVVAWTRDGLVALAPPLARTVARASGGEWHIRARSPRHAIEIRAEAAGPPLRLPVPIPAERRLELRSEHHLAGRLEVTVQRGRRVILRGESALAGLEDGRP
jgi:tocopherol cyclase